MEIFTLAMNLTLLGHVCITSHMSGMGGPIAMKQIEFLIKYSGCRPGISFTNRFFLVAGCILNCMSAYENKN